MKPSILAACLLLAAASPSAAQESSPVVSNYDVTGSEVTFQIGSGYSSVALTVAGPHDFIYEEVFEAGSSPRFSAESQFADGVYMFELTGALALRPEIRAQLTEARKAGDNLLVSAIFADAEVDREGAVASISVGYADGEFVTPTVGEEAQTSVPGQPDGGYQQATIQQQPLPLGAWLEASFQMNAEDGTVLQYTGFIFPPTGDASDTPGHMRAFIRPSDGAGNWVRGYFATEEGAFRFIDQTSFNALGLASTSAAPFDYLSSATAPGTMPRELRDQQIQDDLVVVGSICAGVDCVNGESFGFDTIRLKENNLRIRFVDTSSSSSFPTVDWQIKVNDSANGGSNLFAIEDIDSGTIPFTILSGAPSNSLYVTSSGNIGMGTAAPQVKFHQKNGNTPTLRLEQDRSSGFTAQSWDIGANESNFFIRDVTNGSNLPFRIVPGAPNASIYVAADGDIGFETTTPDGQLDIAHPSDGNNHSLLVSPVGYTGINIDNGFLPNGLLDVQTTGGVSRLTVTADGKVGIGTDGLTLASGSVTSATGAISFGNENLSTTGTLMSSGTITSQVISDATSRAFDMTRVGQTWGFHGDNNRWTLRDVTGGTDMIYATDSGVGILRVPSTYAFEVNGDIHSSGGTLRSDAGAVIASDLTLALGSITSASGSIDFGNEDLITSGSIGLGTTPTTILSIVQNSTTDPVADAWTTYSSRRWKSNIQTLPKALETVMQLRGVSYNWKADGKSDIGLIAEEVGAIIPEIVVFEENGVDAMSLDYARLVAVLIEAIKEQQQLLDSRESEIAVLSDRMDQFNSRLAEIQGLMQTDVSPVVEGR
ncbi:MAG: hypothetical protein ACI9BV_003716 [Rhodothermales bacterium]|jgi:hypothetical protein